MSVAAIKQFCPSCGAKHSPGAKFCGNCGHAFVAETPVMHEAEHQNSVPVGKPSVWQVAVGTALPRAESLFPGISREPRRKKKSGASKSRSSIGSPAKAKPIFGSTLFMAVSQGADLVTRSLEGGGIPGDHTLQLRLGIAAAVAVFGVSLGSMPRLRTVAVKLGAVAIALLQGASLLTVAKGLATDPQLITAMAPNLGAQVTSMLAVFRLFKAVGGK